MSLLISGSVVIQVSFVSLPSCDLNEICYFLAMDTSTFSYYIDGESVPSIQFVNYMLVGAGFNDQTAPWGTKWMGKGAQSGGLYNNL